MKISICLSRMTLETTTKSAKNVTIKIDTVPDGEKRPSVAQAKVQLSAPISSGKFEFVSQQEENAKSPSCGSVVFERTWLWAFILMLLASFTFSVVSMSRTDSDWLVSDRESRAGWRKACVDYIKDQESGMMIVPCKARDSTVPVADIVNSLAGKIGKSIFIVSIVAWVIPFTLMAVAPCFEITRGSCCHGFFIAFYWAIVGATLLGLTFWFRFTVNEHLRSQKHPLFSVFCSIENEQIIDICTDIPFLEECPSKCRIRGTTDDVICVGFQDCRLIERDSTCEEDRVGCELVTGWAMMASMISSLLMILMAVILALGSWNVSKNL